MLVGIGVRIALGCNVGLMWTNFAQLGYDGIMFLFGMLGGVYLAVKVQERLRVMLESRYLRRLLAPLILSFFAIGWYKFSEGTLANANQIALNTANFAVYVQQTQYDGYLTATRYICHAVVYVGLALFWYNLVKIVEAKERNG